MHPSPPQAPVRIGRPRQGLRSLVVLLAAATAGCEAAEQFVDARRNLTPRESYVEGLTAAGLATTALGREWIDAGAAAIRDPRPVSLPFQEEGFIAPEDPSAVGYRFTLERGQVLSWRVQVDSPDSTRVFVDLLRLPADTLDPPRPVSTADTVAGGFAYEPWRRGEYVLRLQPELLRGGRYRVLLSLDAALAFPVDGRGTDAVQSFFGAPRDGGRRDHHGVDIFAPRGTPVLAAVAGVVSRSNETSIGGRVVWLRDGRRNQSLYYAHLDSQAVRRGQRVEVGDTLGFVGNTGNARTTPPHLHFGIYVRGEGPVDPMPWIRPVRGTVPEIRADLARLGEWGKVAGGPASARSGPGESTAVVAELDPEAPVRLMGGAGAWYRVRLGDGRDGYVAAALLEAASRPTAGTPTTSAAGTH